MPQLLNVLGPYKIVKRLGRGGMGDVFLAEDTRIAAGAPGKRVALKVLWRDLEKDAPGVLEAEKQGAQLQARLYAIDHRVARVNSWGELEDVFYIDMEYVEGQDLAELIYTGPLDPRVATQIACEIADILSRAHTLRFEHLNKDSRGVIHGDIKPRNIRIEPSGRVRLFDFGIAKALSATRKLTRNEFGSVSYASPERLNTGDVNEHSDLWSLGVVLFEMLAGHPPFDSDNTRKIERRILDGDGPDVLPPLVPKPVQELVYQALNRRPERRFQSAALFRNALNGLLTGALKDSSSSIQAAVQRPQQDVAEPNLEGEASISLEPLREPSTDRSWETASTGEVPPASRPSRSMKKKQSLGPASEGGEAEARSSRPVPPSAEDTEATRRSFPSGALRAEARAARAQPSSEGSEEAELTRRTISTDPRGEPLRRRPVQLDERLGKASPSEEQSAYDLPLEPDVAEAQRPARRKGLKERVKEQLSARTEAHDVAPPPVVAPPEKPGQTAESAVAPVDAGLKFLKSWGGPAAVALLAVFVLLQELSVRRDLTALEPGLRQSSMTCRDGYRRYAELRGKSWTGARSEAIEAALIDRCIREVDLTLKQYQTDNPGLKKADWAMARDNSRNLLTLSFSPRYEAWELYAEGHVLRIENALEEAISRYQRAAELDNFCDPYLALMHLYAYSKNQDLNLFMDAATKANERGCPPLKKHTVWLADIQYDEAERSFKRLDPKSSSSEQLEAVTRIMGLYTEAKSVYQANQGVGNAKSKLKNIKNKLNELERRRSDLQGYWTYD